MILGNYIFMYIYMHMFIGNIIGANINKFNPLLQSDANNELTAMTTAKILKELIGRIQLQFFFEGYMDRHV